MVDFRKHPVDPDGNLIVSGTPRVGSEVIYATHDFTDPTSWYSTSVRVDDEAATDSGNGLLWNLAHVNVIDMQHGKVLDEETLCAEHDHKYDVVVKVDGVEQTQHPAFTASGDYAVDYEAGTITFTASQAGKAVLVGYSYSTSSAFQMFPQVGRVLDIESAEAQFSADVQYNDTIVFEVTGYVESFYYPAWDQSSPVGLLPYAAMGAELPVSHTAGDLFYSTTNNRLHSSDGSSWTQVPVGPYPSGTRIPLASSVYKTLDQIIDEAVGAYPSIPALGGSVRGITQPRYGFPFRYGTVRRLHSTTGMSLEVRLDSDTKFGGERATATLYCTSHLET